MSDEIARAQRRAEGVTVDIDAISRARAAIGAVVRHTPALRSTGLSERLGCDVVLKAESLQRTGSFKLRGALAKVAALGDAAVHGVVCGSAGNHAQAVAEAARQRGFPCEVYMPSDAPIAKADAAESLGATVHLVDGPVDECVAAAVRRAESHGLAFIHPYDDPDVIAGQGTLGLEIVEDVADVARVVVPLGGGGLASGVAIAIRSSRPEVDVVGVQAQRCMPFPESLRGGPPVTVPPAPTLADGIAVRRPGDITLPLVAAWLADVTTVSEDEIGEGMMLLLEGEKLVVEGAGAVAVAALLSGKVAPARTGSTVVILSGGNVDAAVLAEVARRHETLAGRRLVVLTRVRDRSGALAGLLACLASAGADLVDVAHVREGLDLHVSETAVHLVMRTRGPEHSQRLLDAAAAAGYPCRVLH